MASRMGLSVGPRSLDRLMTSLLQVKFSLLPIFYLKIARTKSHNAYVEILIALSVYIHQSSMLNFSEMTITIHQNLVLIFGHGGTPSRHFHQSSVALIHSLNFGAKIL